MKANKTIRWKVIDSLRGSIWIVNPDPYGFIHLYYFKNKKTTAPKNSIGICCFDSKRKAGEFSKGHQGIIIKVKTYGRGFYPKIENKWVPDTGDFPEGTICYPAVMPLE